MVMAVGSLTGWLSFEGWPEGTPFPSGGTTTCFRWVQWDGMQLKKDKSPTKCIYVWVKKSDFSFAQSNQLGRWHAGCSEGILRELQFLSSLCAWHRLLYGDPTSSDAEHRGGVLGTAGGFWTNMFRFLFKNHSALKLWMIFLYTVHVLWHIE